MSSSYSLRPVSQPSSAIPPMQSPPVQFRPPSSVISPRDSTRVRRPMSPSSLRDVDLTQHGADGPPRSYPAPPTGHELMALFPPMPPTTLNDSQANSTSSYFRREERAFFAQGDREIARVRIDMDLPQGYDRKTAHDKGKGREPLANQNGGPRPYLPQMPPLPPAASASSMAPPIPAASQNARHSRAPSMSVSSSFHTSPHVQHLHHPQQQHDSSGHADNQLEFHPDDMQHDNPDEAWRRPMPYAERRRAGKHTKRVIVRT